MAEFATPPASMWPAASLRCETENGTINVALGNDTTGAGQGIPSEVKGAGYMSEFQWKAFINSGYLIRATIIDPYFHILKNFFKTSKYLSDVRARPENFEFKFWVGWLPGNVEFNPDNPQPDADHTQERLSILIDIDIIGEGQYGAWQIIAIDPVNYYLNRGNGSGKIYEGKVSDVIRQVFDENTPSGFNLEISETEDASSNVWPMMRQDPKTFIKSLLDWSSSVTPKKTDWWTLTKDREMIIKEQSDFSGNGKIIASYRGEWKGRHLGEPNTNEIRSFNYISDTVVTTLSAQTITQGISAVTGKYIDRLTTLDQNLTAASGATSSRSNRSNPAVVDDNNTTNKLNTNIEGDRGFSKPQTRDSNSVGVTAIMAIPEHNGGELGLNYEEYIDGRAREKFLSMLRNIMKIRITVQGDIRFSDPLGLGSNCVNISWADLESDEGFFLGGNWIVYGYHHHLSPKYFETDLYLYRIDHDANAKKIHNSGDAPRASGT